MEPTRSGCPLRRYPTPFPLRIDTTGGITGAEPRQRKRAAAAQRGTGSPLRRMPTSSPEDEGFHRVEAWLRGLPAPESGIGFSSASSSSASTADTLLGEVVGKLREYGVEYPVLKEPGTSMAEVRLAAVEHERKGSSVQAAAEKGREVLGRAGRKVRRGAGVLVGRVREGVMVVGEHVRAGWRQWRGREREERALYGALLEVEVTEGREVAVW
ncbi:hypothetical protein MMC30_006831 [Trapelia coarctata]|nr:hypothetical protein [Trapelia coarctata]